MLADPEREEANESVRNVHDRMPLILEEHEIDMWIHDDKATEGAIII